MTGGVARWDLRNYALAQRVGADWQAGTSIHLNATEDWIGAAQGQLLLLHLANQLPRMGPGFRRIRLSRDLEVPLNPDIARLRGDGTLSQTLLNRMQEAVPGDYSVEDEADFPRIGEHGTRVWIGQPEEPLSARDVTVTTDGWAVRVTLGGAAAHRREPDGRRAAGQYNPISAQWAAAGLCGFLYQRHCMNGASAGIHEWTCWPSAAVIDAPRVDAIDIGDLVLIGCGAVGNAFIEVLRAWPQVRGNLTVYDPDFADETNLNRYLLLDRGQVGRAKGGVAETALISLPDLQVRTYPREIQDRELAAAKRIVLAVDRVAPRLRIQTRWPELLIEAGTGQQWFHVSHCHGSLILRGEVACQACIHGTEREATREEREATAVFVSALTGAVLAREFLLTLEAGLEAARRYNRVNGNAFEPDAVEETKDLPDPKCGTCLGRRRARVAD